MGDDRDAVCACPVTTPTAIIEAIGALRRPEAYEVRARLVK
jgi:hypothetical protein